MTKPIIEVKNISKRYELGAIGATRLRDDVERVWDRVIGRTPKESAKEFWAVRDVSFTVQPGEIVGILGRNGAGKSTLLKILSRITEPTFGEIVMRGRVASLLEVGTGFHGDLTGRENIFLNGAILGMTKAEIRGKLDEIVAFAEIEKFIDTPVKRYSSGMYVRLAFAVAAHLEPEILIIDEVLAVGDQQFQEKCIGKMKQVSRGGRTVLFVSHQPTALKALCSRGVVLQKGKVHKIAGIDECLEGYLSDALSDHDGTVDLSAHPARLPAHMPATIVKVELLENNQPTSLFISGSSMGIRLHLRTSKRIRKPRFAIAIEDGLGRRLLTTASYFSESVFDDIDGGRAVHALLPRLFLKPGRYLLSVSVADHYNGLIDSVDGAVSFTVAWKDSLGTGEPFSEAYGQQVIQSTWEVQT